MSADPSNMDLKNLVNGSYLVIPSYKIGTLDPGGYTMTFDVLPSTVAGNPNDTANAPFGSV